MDHNAPDTTTTIQQEPRVIILGCGLAGLKCARQLVTGSGMNKDRIILLEASSNIGGRIKTNKDFVEGFTLDLGAELIHGDETSLYHFVKERNLETEELITLAQGDGGPLHAKSNKGYGLFYLRGEKRMLAMDSKDPDYVHLNNYLGSLADLWPEMKREFDSRSATASTPRQSLYSGLESTGISQSMMGVADAGYANTAGAALKDIGLFGMCFMEEKWSSDGDRTFVLKGSLGLIVEELSAGLQSCIRTDWPVAKVDCCSAPGRVTVTSKDGKQEDGTHVVCTLPLSVLQDGDVEFLPPLPEKKVKAFGQMGMCHVVKVILKFDRPVLPPLLHGCICSESFIPEFWFRHLPDLPQGGYTCLAVGYVTGPWADAVSALTPEETLKKALDQLDDMFTGREWLERGCTGKGDWEGKAEDSQQQRFPPNYVDDTDNRGCSTMLPSACYVDGLVHDWANEKFVRGGYSYPRLDFDENTLSDAAAAVNEVLFFAGEHTDSPSAHAAINSGNRAALEVARAIKGVSGQEVEMRSMEAAEEAQ